MDLNELYEKAIISDINLDLPDKHRQLSGEAIILPADEEIISFCGYAISNGDDSFAIRSHALPAQTFLMWHPMWSPTNSGRHLG